MCINQLLERGDRLGHIRRSKGRRWLVAGLIVSAFAAQLVQEVSCAEPEAPARGLSAAVTLTGFSSFSEAPLAPGLRLRHESGWHRADVWYERSRKLQEAGGNGGYYLAADVLLGRPDQLQVGVGYRYRNAGPRALDDQGGEYGGWTKRTWRLEVAREWTVPAVDEDVLVRLTALAEASRNATLGLGVTMTGRSGAEVNLALYNVVASPLQSPRRVWGATLGVGYRLPSWRARS